MKEARDRNLSLVLEEKEADEAKKMARLLQLKGLEMLNSHGLGQVAVCGDSDNRE